MPDLYPVYDETTAPIVVRFHPSLLFGELAIYPPPASFAGTPRPVFIFEPGGARQARRDMSIGSSETSPGVHSVPGMFTEELGAYVVIVSTPPGGIDKADAEEAGQEYGAASRLSAALARMFLAANRTNPAVVGSTHTISANRAHWCAGGTSAGVWSQLGAEFIPPADLYELVSEAAARGNGRYRYDWDHRCGHFFGSIGQNRLSGFCEYVIDPALDGLPSTYVTTSTAAAAATAIPIGSDTAELKRANRVSIITTTSYTVNGAQDTGTAALAVTGSAAPIPAGCFVQVVASDAQTYEFVVGADFAGGTGAIDAREWSPSGTVSISSGATITVRQEFAVRTDFAGGAGSLQVWPSVQFPIQSGSAVELLHDATLEGYGEHSWAVGYCGTASMGRVWRSDDASGRGVPLGEKRDADVDRVIVPSNPRALELNLMISGAFGQTLQRVDDLTGERSFWMRRNNAEPTILPEHCNLHDEGDMVHLMHQLYALRQARGINVNGLAAYVGSRRSNPTGTGLVPANQPYLLGRNAGFDAQVLKAWLTDSARFGGAFA